MQESSPKEMREKKLANGCTRQVDGRPDYAEKGKWPEKSPVNVRKRLPRKAY